MKYRGASMDYCTNTDTRKLTLCFVNDSLLISPCQNSYDHQQFKLALSWNFKFSHKLNGKLQITSNNQTRPEFHLLQRGETREHRRWKVESLDSGYLRKNRGKLIKGKIIGVLREKVKVVEPVRRT